MVPRIVAELYLPWVRKAPLPSPQSLRDLALAADVFADFEHGASYSTSLRSIVVPGWVIWKMPP